MAIPKLVTVSGIVRDSAGTPRSGIRATLTTHTVVRETATGDIMVPTPITDTTSADGILSFDVPATDDPGFSPSGWTWRLKIDGVDRYDVAIPYARDEIELAELVPIPGAPAGQLYATLAALDALQDQVDAGGGGGGGGGMPSGTVAAETTFGISSSAGVASAYSRGDHTHGTPATPTPAGIGAATTAHTHSGTYDPAGTAATAVAAHVAASDPHPQYLTTAEGGAAYQPLDSDLTTLAGLTATTDNMVQSVGSAWASRTPAQVKTALALNNLDNTSDANKPVSTAGQTALDAKQPIIKKWNGSAYVVATGAEIYVGAGTPTSPADGSVWLTS